MLDFEQAGLLLDQGEVLLFPTETFWGIATSPFSKKGVSKILEMKTRSLADGIPCIISDAGVVERFIVDEEESVKQARLELQNKHWPGPMTIVFEVNEKARPLFASGILASDYSLAVRVSSSKVARDLAKISGGIISSTSANPHGMQPPKTAQEAIEYFPELEILDALEEKVSADNPSTIVDVRTLPFKTLRQGAVRI